MALGMELEFGAVGSRWLYAVIIVGDAYVNNATRITLEQPDDLIKCN